MISLRRIAFDRIHLTWLGPLLLAVAFCYSSIPAHAEDESTVDPLDAYLAELELDELQIVYLQQQLKKGNSTNDKSRFGRRLADLLAEKLTRVADNADEYERTLEDVRRLLAEVPSANTLSLQVMLQQADYLRAERVITAWLDDRKSEQLRGEAEALLEQTAGELIEHREQINDALKRLNQQLDEANDDEQTAAIDQQIQRLRVVQFRASYYSGWASYYLAVVGRNTSRQASDFEKSEIAFREFIGVDRGEKLADIPADWLDLSSVLQARGVAGLAMALAGKEENEASEHLFEILGDASNPIVVKESLPLWKLLSRLNLNRIDQATELARANISTFSGKATREATQYCVTLLRYAQHPPQGIGVNKSVTILALEGLIRLRQFSLIQELVDEYSINLAEDNGFYTTWIRGNLAFAQAEEVANREAYLNSARILEQAVSSDEAALDSISLGHCQYQLGWALFFGEEYEPAASAFERASLILAANDSETAANSAWKRYECYRKLADVDSRFLVMAMEALRTLQANFPNHRLAKTAAYHLSKLQQTQVPLEESIETLEEIPSDDSNYANARFELCLLYHQLWNQQLQEKKNAQKAQGKLREAITTYQQLGRQATPERRVQTSLLLVDTGLRSNPRDLAMVKEQLVKVASMAEELPSESRVAAEYHYQRFQLARLESNQAETLAEAEWLVDYAPSSAYVQSALVLLAQSVEKELNSATGSQRLQALEKAEDIYEKLVRLYGTDADTLSSNKNARVSLYRLANLSHERGNHGDAAQRFEQLLGTDSKNEAYLRGAARAWFASGRYSTALTYWRQLSLGLKKGSEDWMEAKYHVIACLAEEDPAEAREVLKQFRRLYPSPAAGAWEESLQRIEQQL